MADAAATAAGPATATQPTRAVARAANPIEAEIVTLTRRWNDALAKRDAQALASVYGARVQLYDKSIDRAATLKAKAAALASAKDYTQAISAVEVDLRDAARPKAVFDKKWVANGKADIVRGSLAFAKEGEKWVIVEESDAKTDDRRARVAMKDTCESLVVGLVMSNAEVTRLVNGPTNPAAGHASNGLRIAGGPPESPTYAVAVHESHADRLVTLGWFDVNPKTGVVTDAIDGSPQKVDPVLVEKVKATCGR